MNIENMTLAELKTLETLVVTRIGHLDPRRAFREEINENKPFHAELEGRNNDDYDDEHYLEWLQGETPSLTEEQEEEMLKAEASDDEITFYEGLYLKAHQPK